MRPPPVLPPLLEHINLNIPSEALARDFYVGLGGAVNPKTSNWRQLHINAGASQWHLLHSLSRPDVTPPGEPVRERQLWPGLLELWTKEPLVRMRDRLARVHAADPPPGPPPPSDDSIAVGYGEGGRWPAVPTLSADGKRLLCACPWGNRFEIREAPAGYSPEGQHPGGAGSLVAIRRLVHPIGLGGAAPAAAFFSDVLGCETVRLEEDERLGGPSCVVPFASGQTLHFVETADAPAADAYVTDEAAAGYHLAMYVADHERFGRAFDLAQQRDCLFLNERFEGGPPEFGNAMTRELAMACGQFRVRDVRDSAGKLVLMLELEVRSPRHISCPLPKK